MSSVVRIGASLLSAMRKLHSRRLAIWGAPDTALRYSIPRPASSRRIASGIRRSRAGPQRGRAGRTSPRNSASPGRRASGAARPRRPCRRATSCSGRSRPNQRSARCRRSFAWPRPALDDPVERATVHDLFGSLRRHAGDMGVAERRAPALLHHPLRHPLAKIREQSAPTAELDEMEGMAIIAEAAAPRERANELAPRKPSTAADDSPRVGHPIASSRDPEANLTADRL